MPIDPRLRAHLDSLPPAPPLDQVTPDLLRARITQIIAGLNFPDLPHVPTRDTHIPGPAGDIPVRIYQPETFGSAPVIVHFHGGGWVVGSLDSHDRVVRALAGRAGAVAVSVDYRLAPEHPFPAAPRDAIAATRWILASAAALGIDASAVAVGGDSAGGNLSAVVSQALRGERLRPAFQLLVYPGTDLTRSLPSHALFPDSYFLGKEAGDWYLGLYLPDASAARDPLGSPLFASDLSGLAPALVITAGFDPLRDEGRAYAEKMRAAGTEVEQVCFEGQMHGFLMLGGAIDDAARAVDLAVDRLRRALRGRAA